MQHDPEQISTPPDGRPMSEQPAWRQDFPIDTPQDNYVARRDFTKFLVVTSGAFVAGQLYVVAKSQIARDASALAPQRIASIADLPVGGALTFNYPEPHDTCILLRPDENTLLAYSQKCTHLSCAVVPDMKRNCLNCPCHEGVFDMATGHPLAGPPRRPLPLVHVERRGDELWATGVEVRTV
ncbi:MAG TPA: Rieske (2Fe-2S) protein [Phycisphaerae bacterium]|nr:Rieske (2Fe-2S) protein [Phycisphaerae bacterium]